MENPAETLNTVVETAVGWLMAVLEADTTVRRGEDWCAKEVMGHLIDSAVNNHVRFVCAQLTDDLVFSGYDQAAWVRVTHAADEPWPALVSLWRGYNLHLAHIVAAIPEETLHRPRVRHSLNQIPAEQPVTLEYLIRDYIGHLEDHLRQINALTGPAAT